MKSMGRTAEAPRDGAGKRELRVAANMKSMQKIHHLPEVGKSQWQEGEKTKTRLNHRYSARSCE